MVSENGVPDPRATRPKRLPRVIKYQDFIFVTPMGTARVRANIILIRDEGGNTISVDCGSAADPGNQLLKAVFKKYDISGAHDVSVLITHSHADHIANYWWFRSQFPHLESYASETEYRLVTFPFSTPPYWDRIHDMLGGKPATKVLRRVGMVFAAPRIFGQVRYYYPITHTFPANMTRLKIGGRIITPVLTPGHSPGHCAYLDESKVLFLGDLVPNTPWLDPAPWSLSQMIDSIRKLLRIPDRKVETVVRSHCNSSDHGRFIYPWAEERARFETFLNLIFETLEKLPVFLRGRVVSTSSVGKEIYKNLFGYSPLMTRLWVPPGMSWVVGYLGYLEQQGKIHQISGYNQIAWSS